MTEESDFNPFDEKLLTWRRQNAFLAAIGRMIEEAEMVLGNWDPSLADNGSYPNMPSFDEWLDELMEWRDACRRRKG